MSNKLRQPHIAAQVCENRPGTLLPPRSKSQNSRRTWLRRSPLSFLNGHVLLHAARQPQGTKRLHHQRDPAQGRQGLFEWLGIYFEQ